MEKTNTRTNPSKVVAPIEQWHWRQHLIGNIFVDTWQSVVILTKENTAVFKKLIHRHPKSIPHQCFGVLRGRGPMRSCLRAPQHGQRGSNQHLHPGAPSWWHEKGPKSWMLQPVLGLQKTGCWSAVSSLHPSPDPAWDLWKRETAFPQCFSLHSHKTVTSSFWISLSCQKVGETGIRKTPGEAVIWLSCEVTKAGWRSSWALKLIYFKGCQERGHTWTHTHTHTHIGSHDAFASLHVEGGKIIQEMH